MGHVFLEVGAPGLTSLIKLMSRLRFRANGFSMQGDVGRGKSRSGTASGTCDKIRACNSSSIAGPGGCGSAFLVFVNNSTLLNRAANFNHFFEPREASSSVDGVAEDFQNATAYVVAIDAEVGEDFGSGALVEDCQSEQQMLGSHVVVR